MAMIVVLCFVGSAACAFPTPSGTLTLDLQVDADGVDFGFWQTDYPTATPAPTAVPEPATLGLLLVGGLLLLNRRHRSR